MGRIFFIREKGNFVQKTKSWRGYKSVLLRLKCKARPKTQQRQASLSCVYKHADTPKPMSCLERYGWRIEFVVLSQACYTKSVDVYVKGT